MTASFSVRPHAWCTPMGLFAVIGPSRNRNSGAPARSAREAGERARVLPVLEHPRLDLEGVVVRVDRGLLGRAGRPEKASRRSGARCTFGAEPRAFGTSTFSRMRGFLLCLFAAFLALFAGCSGDDDNSSGTTTVHSTDASSGGTTVPGTPTPEEQELSDRIFVSTEVTGHDLVTRHQGHARVPEPGRADRRRRLQLLGRRLHDRRRRPRRLRDACRR